MFTTTSIAKSARETKIPRSTSTTLSYAQPPRYSRSNVSSTLKVLVGPYAETFYMNKESICATSRFFETACEGFSQDSHRQTITLIDIEAEAFAIFVSWLTTSNISNSSAPLRDKVGAELVEQHVARWQQLCRCYNLGEFLGSLRFKNAVMDALVDISKALVLDCNTFPVRTAEELEIVYKATKPGSVLRMLVVDLAVGCLGIGNLERIREKRHLDEFCTEVLDRTCDLLSDHQEGKWRDGCYLEYPWECLATRYHYLGEEA